jgi:hypothetical protein
VFAQQALDRVKASTGDRNGTLRDSVSGELAGRESDES